MCFTKDRLDVDMADPNDARRLLARKVGSLKIEWTDGSISGGRINWFGWANPKGGAFETSTTDHYLADWKPSNQADWPKAMKFTFTLYDSKRHY